MLQFSVVNATLLHPSNTVCYFLALISPVTLMKKGLKVQSLSVACLRLWMSGFVRRWVPPYCWLRLQWWYLSVNVCCLLLKMHGSLSVSFVALFLSIFLKEWKIISEIKICYLSFLLFFPLKMENCIWNNNIPFFFLLVCNRYAQQAWAGYVQRALVWSASSAAWPLHDTTENFALCFFKNYRWLKWLFSFCRVFLPLSAFNVIVNGHLSRQFLFGYIFICTWCGCLCVTTQ